LPLHALKQGEVYRLGFFLVGAYQEILGDIHNLFGDTDAVEVHLDGERLRDEPAAPRRYDGRDAGLRRVQARCVARGVCEESGRRGVGCGRSARLKDALEAGLTAYTYLSDEPV
jgi:arginine decarboxylase